MRIYRKHLIDSQNRLNKSEENPPEGMLARFRCCRRRSDDEEASEQPPAYSKHLPGIENTSFSNAEVRPVDIKHKVI